MLDQQKFQHMLDEKFWHFWDGTPDASIEAFSHGWDKWLDGRKDSCAGGSALRVKLTSLLESMIEDKFRSMKFAEWGARTEDWNLWLDANDILKLRCGCDHFNPRNSDLIYISNPAHRFAVTEKDILAVDKEFAMKAFLLGFLP